MPKTYIGFSRDHSGSMNPLRHAALRDYNNSIATIKKQAKATEQDTNVFTVRCGINGGVDRETINSNVHMLKPLEHYAVSGMTPLFDSIGELIEMMEKMPDANDTNVAFLIMVITDGAENASHKWKTRLKGKIQELQNSDRWSFVFRVPRGYSYNLTSLGIPSGNIIEWDQTEESLETSTHDTSVGLSNFYAQRSKGLTATRTFYTDLSAVSSKDVKQNLVDVSSEVEIGNVSTKQHDMEISCIVPALFNRPMIRGCAFYQLTKPEKAIQDNKQIIIREKKTGKVYSGPSARKMLGFPEFGSIKVAPGNHGAFDIFVQSTSMNRKVKAGTQVLFWAKAI